MKRGFTLVELLTAIVIAVIIGAALLSLFIVGNRTFGSNRDVSQLTESARNALTTLEFVFSRWGFGVPCSNNNCDVSSVPVPDCGSYPPSDPMCLTVSTNGVEFYASLYGMGFVTSVGDGQTRIISCRLSSDDRKNCYYVWRNQGIANWNGSGTPPVYQLPTINEVSCIESFSPNLTLNGVQLSSSNNSSQISLSAGNLIIRVPHKISIYLSNGWLMMDRTDMAGGCNENESAVRLARASDFKVEKAGRGVKLEITFVSEGGRNVKVVRYFGR